MQGIYRILNKFNGNVYIGQVHANKGHKRRWIEHVYALRRNTHYNKHLQSAWNKYGEDAFVFEMVEEISDEGQLDFVEQRWINQTWNFSYNIQPTAGGSCLGQKRVLTDVAKDNIAAANKARAWTEKDRENQSRLLKGIKRTAKFKARRREIMLGSTQSFETRKKKSDKLKGRKFSPETIEKMRQAAKLREKKKAQNLDP